MNEYEVNKKVKEIRQVEFRKNLNFMDVLVEADYEEKHGNVL